MNSYLSGDSSRRRSSGGTEINNFFSYCFVKCYSLFREQLPSAGRKKKRVFRRLKEVTRGLCLSNAPKFVCILSPNVPPLLPPPPLSSTITVTSFALGAQNTIMCLSGSIKALSGVTLCSESCTRATLSAFSLGMEVSSEGDMISAPSADGAATSPYRRPPKAQLQVQLMGHAGVTHFLPESAVRCVSRQTEQ